jgi:hypothetical protein
MNGPWNNETIEQEGEKPSYIFMNLHMQLNCSVTRKKKSKSGSENVQ